MVAIRVLPPDVVNRIAAGEVVERPASVIKELLENAIDAQATRIEILVEDGGRKRIRVRDDGCGIAPEDLPLAFISHATSKLALDSPEHAGGLDLFLMETLGFRGEALASIAAVAEVEAVSRTRDAELAHRFRPAFGSRAAIGPEPAAAPPGTTIEIRDLFANTPARRKFLRSAATELSHVTEQTLRIGLGFPSVGITLHHGARRVLDLAADGDLRRRLAGVVGEEAARALIEIAAPPVAGGVRVRGLVGAPSVHRPDSRGQNLFVNGRWIRDRVLAHALREAYQGFQIPGRQPVAYVFLDLPREEVDVNVHPQKTEVRFQDSQKVHRALFGAVRAALGGPSPAGAAAQGGAPALPDRTRERLRAVEAATADFFDGPRAARPPLHGGAAGARMRTGSAARGPEPAIPAAPGVTGADAGPRPAMEPAMERSAAPAAALSPAGAAPAAAFQVLRSYIVSECADGILLFDQHALHEKVLYERILAQLRRGDVPAQRLLLPEVVTLPAELAPFLPEIIDRLRAFGFEIDPFGEREVAVQAVPTLLDRGPAAEVILAVAAAVRDHPEGATAGAAGVVDASVRRIAALMACKQATKAGMKLASEEIRSLLAEAERATDPRFCPHGRPTSVLLRKEEIERRFDRKG